MIVEFIKKFLVKGVTKIILICISSFQIGINPGLYAAFKGHHYAGPGNHFCKYIKILYTGVSNDE